VAHLSDRREGRGIAAALSSFAATVVAIGGVALEAVEMAFHTVAAVDHANLVAGRPTPVLTTHLWMAVAIYPLFGVAVI